MYRLHCLLFGEHVITCGQLVVKEASQLNSCLQVSFLLVLYKPELLFYWNDFKTFRHSFSH